MRIARRSLTAVLAIAIAIVVAVPSAAGAAWTTSERVASAAGFISSQQRNNGSIPAFSPIGSTADAVVSLVAAERGPVNIKKALNFLTRRAEDGDLDNAIGLQAKVVMAAVAGGRNPRTFGGHDLVQEIADTEQPDGRYGASTAVFDHALAMLALDSAGQDPSAAARTWLLQQQCGDGGWAYDLGPQPNDDSHCQDTIDPFNDWFTSDTNTTANAVMALEADNGAGQPAADPFSFFASVRDGSNGWPYTGSWPGTDANSTALVIQAYAAAGQQIPAGAMAALKGLQMKGCGGFRYQTGLDPDVGSTIGGVLGLLRQPLPVTESAVTKAPPATIGCP